MRAGLRPDERAAGRARPRRPHGPHGRRIFPRPGPGRALLRRQHLPLHASGLRSVGAARPHSFGGRLSADARHRHGRAAGTHHHDEQGLDHLGAGDLRARRRLDRPRARHLVRALGRDDRAESRDLGKGHLSRRSTRSTPPRASSIRASSARSTTASRARCSASCSATSRCRTSSPFSAWTSSRKTTSSSSRARARSSASCRSRSTSPKSSPTRPASSSTSPTRSKASTASAAATTTICRSRRSSWSARSRTR